MKHIKKLASKLAPSLNTDDIDALIASLSPTVAGDVNDRLSLSLGDDAEDSDYDDLLDFFEDGDGGPQLDIGQDYPTPEEVAQGGAELGMTPEQVAADVADFKAYVHAMTIGDFANAQRLLDANAARVEKAVAA